MLGQPAIELESVNAVNRFHRKTEREWCASNESLKKPNTSMVADEIAQIESQCKRNDMWNKTTSCIKEEWLD